MLGLAQCLGGQLGEAGDVRDVALEPDAPLAQHLQQHIGALAAGRGAARLVLVHALVREAQGIRRGGYLGRDVRKAVGAADLEHVAGLGERGRGDRDGLRALAVLVAGEHAELVAAHPVRGATALHRAAERHSQAVQQRVAGRMAEGVVVLLEAVEVEEAENPRPRAALGVQLGVEVLDQRAAVAQAGERVGQGFHAACREEALVVLRQGLCHCSRAAGAAVEEGERDHEQGDDEHRADRRLGLGPLRACPVLASGAQQQVGDRAGGPAGLGRQLVGRPAVIAPGGADRVDLGERVEVRA